jgi:hypothetical protein
MLFEGQRLLAAVAVLLFMLWGRPALATEKWAVLVGVGDYIHGTQLDLDGPANDVQMIEELLLGKFGYRSEQIRKMVDAQATKANILAGLKWVRDQAKPGDVVLIYYSGHGSQAWDEDGDEQDGRDEVLCPADIVVGQPGYEISDDELRTILAQLQDTDVTVIFDACHAGTGTRDLEFNAGSRPLQMRAVDLGYPLPKHGIRAFDLGDHRDGFDLPATPANGTRSLSGGGAFTMIASCAPHETSASTLFKYGGKRVWSGVLTYNLVKALQKADNTTTYRELISSVLRDVKKINRRQTPQVEGDSDRLIFANIAQQTDSRNLVRVTRVDGKRVEMRSSLLEGERPGSIYRAMASRQGKTTGRIKVTRVVGHLLEGEVIEGKVKAPGLAVEEFHAASDQKLHLLLADFGDEQINEAMRSRLQRLDFIRLASADSAYYDMQLKGEVEGTLLSLLQGYKISAWLEEAGVRSRAVEAENVDEVMGVLRPLLENAYAIKKLSRMDNPSPPFKVSVWATPMPKPGRRKDKFLEMKVGDPIYFHFRAERDAYLTLLNVGAEGSITVLFPNEFTPINRVIKGKTYSIPTPEMGFKLTLGEPGGQELVKAFATEFPLDLKGLNAQAVSGFRAFEFEGQDGYGPSVVDGLAAAINSGFAAHMPSATRAIMLAAAPQQQPTQGLSTDNWATDYLIIEVKH